MRQIFNATLPALSTIPLTAKSAEEQQAWWNGRDPALVRGFLYSPVAWPWEMVAFSLLTQRDGFTTPLFAIDPAWQGRGYGAEIIRHYIAEARGPLAGSALRANAAISHLNAKAGWIEVGGDTKVAQLYHPGAVEDRDATRQQEIYDSIMEYHSSRSAVDAEAVGAPQGVPPTTPPTPQP
jgi:GNAT superfamily N-acetyltransferase